MQHSQLYRDPVEMLARIKAALSNQCLSCKLHNVFVLDMLFFISTYAYCLQLLLDSRRYKYGSPHPFSSNLTWHLVADQLRKPQSRRFPSPPWPFRGSFWWDPTSHCALTATNLGPLKISNATSMALKTHLSVHHVEELSSHPVPQMMRKTLEILSLDRPFMITTHMPILLTMLGLIQIVMSITITATMMAL